MFHITAIAVMPPNIKIINYFNSSSVRQCVNNLFFCFQGKTGIPGFPGI